MTRHPLPAALLILSLVACGDTETAGPDGDQGGVGTADVAEPAPDADQSDGTDPADGEEPTEDAAQDAGQDAGPVAEVVTPPVCDCQVWQHCDETDTCVADLCEQGTTTCAAPTEEEPDLEAQAVCSADGSALEIVPCGQGEVCYLGLCEAPACEAGETLGCEDGQIKMCNSIGTDFVLIPCQGGTACHEGVCVEVSPNVILLLDTSGSMNAIDLEGTTPGECEGDECAAWDWPNCDTSDAPQTRLGKAKKALLGVLASEEAAEARMALQRFPQKFDLFKLLGQSDPTCDGVPLVGFDLWAKDNTTVHQSHQIEELAPDGSDLAEIMPVPFGMDLAETNVEISRWIDGVHTYEPDGETCTNLSTCSMPIANKACIAGECSVSVEPELRAMGKTPLGRALFYAGEIYRHTVIAEGRTCADDTDCHSPHYSCVDGACHDPFRTCRPNLVILFSDGAETQDTDPELFFHPRIQAKRLQHGLGCSTADDCLNGAQCADGLCHLPTDTALPQAHHVVEADTCYRGEVVSDSDCLDAVGEGEDCCQTEGVCHGTSVPCANNSVCAPYPYPCGGTASTCSGTCEDIDTGYVDSAGQDVLRDLTGAPFAVTVHVVDAAEAPTGTQLVAALGGGQHTVVDLDDLDGILEVFAPLLDVKVNTDACP